MTTEYLIERLDARRGWQIIECNTSAGAALRHMHDFQKQFPTSAHRVIEHPSGMLVRLHDPNVIVPCTCA